MSDIDIDEIFRKLDRIDEIFKKLDRIDRDISKLDLEIQKIKNKKNKKCANVI
ncbi:hypothetical protein [uncultured archaeal virus]|uniref:Uncharacterized protein n=1 Tax=uncultured archaeal virus TaxID=1960247 RepID=A0A8B0LT07_9VIRU|nr:hypothetical protein [uncultured archaeal virus]